MLTFHQEPLRAQVIALACCMSMATLVHIPQVALHLPTSLAHGASPDGGVSHISNAPTSSRVAIEPLALSYETPTSMVKLKHMFVSWQTMLWCRLNSPFCISTHLKMLKRMA